MASKKQEFRTERDRFGEVAVPLQAYWGAQTARRVQNAIKVSSMNPRFLEAVLLVHKAAAHSNAEAGKLDPSLARIIGQTVDEVLAGQWQDQFVVNTLQPSAVPDLIANVREVLANRSGEILGAQLGSYSIVHPEHHVGLDRIAADDFASALRVALLLLQKDLESPLRDLERLLRRKALDFDRFAKTSTNFSGSEPVHADVARMFNGYGAEVGKMCKRISEMSNNLQELPVSRRNGTEYGASVRLDQNFASKLSSFTGLNLRLADESRKPHAANDFVEFSSGLRLLAVTLNNLSLEDLEPSGKPAAEFMGMVAYQVIGVDSAICGLAQSGSRRTEAFLALAAYNLLLSLELLKQAVLLLNQQCINSIGSNVKLSSNDRSVNLAASI